MGAVLALLLILAALAGGATLVSVLDPEAPAGLRAAGGLVLGLTLGGLAAYPAAARWGMGAAAPVALPAAATPLALLAWPGLRRRAREGWPRRPRTTWPEALWVLGLALVLARVFSRAMFL